MAWSIFTDGGGDPVAIWWATQLLNKIGAPVTPGNITMVYQWEKSEGGGGKYNPLNQGDVPGNSSLTSTGSQYGGGAADYVSWSAGITGAADYLNMPAYSGVLNGLKSNNPGEARAALWSSPWASSHYGYGSAWSNAVPQGGAQIPSGGDTVQSSVSTTGATTTSSDGSSLFNEAVNGFLGGLLGVNPKFAISNPLAGVDSIANDFETYLKWLSWIFMPSSWLRIGAFVVGAVSLGGAVFMIKDAI